MFNLASLSRRVSGSVAAVMVGLSVSAGATSTTSAHATSVSVKVADEGEDPNYWTEDRRATARPMTLDEVESGVMFGDLPVAAHSRDAMGAEPRVLAEPTGPVITRGRAATTNNEDSVGDEDHNVRYGEVPPTVGRLYFTSEGEARHCTASVVNNNDRNVIMTAAHCAHDGGGGDWRDNFAFYPMYDNGHGPNQRVWNWSRVMAPKAWTNDSEGWADQAFIELKPFGTTTIVDHVGGNGLTYNGVYDKSDVVAWGYPSLYGYNGLTPYFCKGSTSEGQDGDAGYAVMNCGLNSGASGGPWLVDREDKGRGYIHAVTSTCGRDNIFHEVCQADPRTILAAPNGAYVENMFEKIQVGDWTPD